MAGEVSAADGALKAGADVVASTRGSLTQQLGTLEGKLSSVGSGWTGQGATAFNNLMIRWREDANKIVGALNEFEANLLASQSTYTASDDQQASTLTNIAGRLNPR